MTLNNWNNFPARVFGENPRPERKFRLNINALYRKRVSVVQ